MNAMDRLSLAAGAMLACTLGFAVHAAESPVVSGAVERAAPVAGASSASGTAGASPASGTSAPAAGAPPARAAEAGAEAPQVAADAATEVASAQPAAKKPAPAARSGGNRGGSGRALDRLELDTTAITGNRELPKVMVVVPWKKSDIGDLVGKPVNSLIDEALQPVDREVFRREIDYYGALGPDRPRGETPVTDAAIKGPPEK